MKLKAVFTFLLLVGFGPLIMAQENNKKFIGLWKGEYESNGQTYSTTITLTEKEGKLAGIATSTEDPSGSQMPMEKLEIKGNKFSFTVMGTITYDGALNEAKGIIEGILVGNNGQSMPLVWKKEETKTDLQKFVGTWEGEVNSDGNLQKVLFVISESNGKVSGTLELVGKVQAVPLDFVKITGNKVQFEFQAANVGYEGVYNESKNIIEGSGSENGKSIPLSFKKGAVK